jgi:hypothetical protein
MKKVSVAAERDYTVSIGSPWNAALVPLMQSRTRVAIIISSGFSPDLTSLQTLDCEVHISLFQMAKMRRILQPFLIFGIGLAQLALLAQT